MPRRPRNIEKRGERYYYRRVIDGRRKRWFLGRNLAEAKTRAQGIEQGITNGRVSIPDPRAETVASFGERWLKKRIATARNEKGLRLARQRLEQHICPV